MGRARGHRVGSTWATVESAKCDLEGGDNTHTTPQLDRGMAAVEGSSQIESGSFSLVGRDQRDFHLLLHGKHRTQDYADGDGRKDARHCNRELVHASDTGEWV